MTSPPLDNTRSNNVVCDMPSPPLDNTLGKTTSSVACHHHCWAGHTVKRRSACHDITSLGQYTWSNNVGRVMTSPPLDSTHGRQRRVCHDITALGQQTRSATSGVACHHRPWTTHTVGRRRAWHDITVLGQYTWSNYVGCRITSPPFDSTHGRMTLDVACHHRLLAV